MWVSKVTFWKFGKWSLGSFAFLLKTKHVGLYLKKKKIFQYQNKGSVVSEVYHILTLVF